MFRRRLLLLLGLLGFAMLAIVGQMGRLTVVQGAELLAEAERRLVRTGWIPTVRGRVLDRKGRVLAHDRAGYDAAVDYAVITGDWARDAAATFARRAHRSDWPDLTAAQREALIEGYLPRFVSHVDAMWDKLAAETGESRAAIDRRREEIIERVEQIHASVADRARKRLMRERQDQGLSVGANDLARIESIASQPIREQRLAHVVYAGVPDEVAFGLTKLAEREVVLFERAAGLVGARIEAAVSMLPGLEIVNAAERVYPFDAVAVDVDMRTMPSPLASDQIRPMTATGVGWHVLGRVRTGTYREDAEARAAALASDAALREQSIFQGVDRGRYRPDDVVGHAGVEASLEHRLRGLRGMRIENLSTGDVRTVERRPGQDVQLTLDVFLQARIRAIMDPRLGLATVQPWHRSPGDHDEALPIGTPLDGAAVVLDVESGEILAMVSTPGVPRDGDWSAFGLETDAAVAMFDRVRTPHVNRAIAKPYPPGSIAKALVLCGAVDVGEYGPGERIPATGHLLPDRPDVFRSWIFKQYAGTTHRDQLGRDPDGVDALMVSANVFFYTLGQRLGGRRIADAYRRFGVGDGYGLGIGVEWPGKIGAFDGPGDGSDLIQSDAILLGIGQGPVTWTPLHAADSYATLARGGVRVHPRIVRDGAPPTVEDVGLDPRGVDDALQGLFEVVNNARFGTGQHLTIQGVAEPIFNAPGIAVWGKTGTATAPDIRVDPDDDGPLPERVVYSGDHSWFVVLAGDRGGRARYVIAVVMDYAGSGGRVSGPIANQIIHALVAEGYLRGSGGGSGCGSLGGGPS